MQTSLSRRKGKLRALSRALQPGQFCKSGLSSAHGFAARSNDFILAFSLYGSFYSLGILTEYIGFSHKNKFDSKSLSRSDAPDFSLVF